MPRDVIVTDDVRVRRPIKTRIRARRNEHTRARDLRVSCRELRGTSEGTPQRWRPLSDVRCCGQSLRAAIRTHQSGENGRSHVTGPPVEDAEAGPICQ